MIISRTPLRISFCGGGSDLKEYYREYGGCVISTSINKYVYLNMHPYFYDDKCLLKYSQTEEVNNVNEIKHNLIREVFRKYDIRGVDFNSGADIPAQGTGLGSSSAYTVGLITLCNAYNGRYCNKETAASIACDIEINCLGEPIGKQDQYACAIGGMNYLSFNPDDSVNIEKIILNKENHKKLQNRLVLFYTGKTRSSKEILTIQKNNTIHDKSKKQNMHEIVELAKILKNDLCSGNINSLGEILHDNWCLKKQMSPNISDSYFDEIYFKARKNGAEGGKLLGAGGGGFFLFYVLEGNSERLEQSLKPLRKFNFEFDKIGTTIIYSD